MSTNEALGFAWQRVKADPLTILGTLGLGMLVVTVTTRRERDSWAMATAGGKAGTACHRSTRSRR